MNREVSCWNCGALIEIVGWTANNKYYCRPCEFGLAPSGQGSGEATAARSAAPVPCSLCGRSQCANECKEPRVDPPPHDDLGCPCGACREWSRRRRAAQPQPARPQGTPDEEEVGPCACCGEARPRRKLLLGFWTCEECCDRTIRGWIAYRDERIRRAMIGKEGSLERQQCVGCGEWWLMPSCSKPPSRCEMCIGKPERVDSMSTMSKCEKCGVSYTGGHKCDGGKNRYALIPVGPMQEVAKVYTMGAAKYSDGNWRKGMPYDRLFSALERHLHAWWAGERNDPVDGQHHLSSVVFCALTLMEFEVTHPELDNRPREVAWNGKKMEVPDAPKAD